MALLRAFVSGDFQDLEHLREMQRLAHIHHVNGLCQVGIIAELVLDQRQVFGGIQRRLVRAQDHRRAILFLRQAEHLVYFDDHRPTLRTLVNGDAALHQLFDLFLAGLFLLAVEVVHVEMDVQCSVHLPEAFQRPLARLLPQSHDFRLAPVPAGVDGAHLSFQVRLCFEALRGLGVNLAHPLGDVRSWFLAVVVFQVAPQPLDDV